MPAASSPPSLDLQPILLPPPPVPGDGRWRMLVYPHTHWDREWYRSFERFRMQLVGVVDRLLDVLDRDGRYARFVLDGQAIVLEDYLELRPEELPRLRRLVGAGRIEVGPWYVLPDEFLVSGESLVRNLHEGRRVTARFGSPLAVGYLPDPFGHVAQLPAVLRGFGIDNVLFSRGMGDEFARTGSEFRWESPAGVDVLALVQASTYTSGYCNAELLGRGHQATDEEPYRLVTELGPHLASHARSDVLLLAAGCDHETIQDELPDLVDRIASLVPGADVRIAGIADAVEAVRDAERRLEAAGGALERHRGELRGSLHAPILSSIFSARIPLKQRNDALQVLLERHVEPLTAAAVLAGVRPARDVEPFLRHAWRLVMQNHPHDSIGGCSTDRVHEEMHARTLRADAIARGLLEDLRIATRQGGVAVCHDPLGAGGVAERADGSPLCVAPGTPGVLVELGELVLATGAEVVDDSCVRAGAVVARIAGGEGVEPWLEVVCGEDSVRLDWVDEGDAGDEYDFGPVPDAPVRARVVDWSTRMAGPGVAELDVRHELALPARLARDRRRRSEEVRMLELRTRVRVSQGSPLAQLVVTFDNRCDDHRLRARATPARGMAPDAVVEALGHFAVVERPLRPPTPLAQWRQLPPGLDHCAGAVRVTPAGERSQGLLLAGRGIHEYEVVELAGATGHALELTVLRAVGWLSRDDVPGRPGHAGPRLETPGAQCHGPHRVDVAVGVGQGASFEAAAGFLAPPLVLEPFGVGMAQDPRATDAPDEDPLESGAIARARDVLRCTPEGARERLEGLGLRAGGTEVVVSACKLADDGSGDLVVRWWAPAGGRAPRAWLELAAPVRDAWRTRIDEAPLGPAPFEHGRCELSVRPGAIVTVRVALVR